MLHVSTTFQSYSKGKRISWKIKNIIFITPLGVIIRNYQPGILSLGITIYVVFLIPQLELFLSLFGFSSEFPKSLSCLTVFSLATFSSSLMTFNIIHVVMIYISSPQLLFKLQTHLTKNSIYMSDNTFIFSFSLFLSASLSFFLKILFIHHV